VLERDLRSVSVLVVPGLDQRMVVHWARAQRRLLDVGDVKEDVLYQEAVKAMLKARKARGGDGDRDACADDDGEGGEEDGLFEDVDLDVETQDVHDVCTMDLFTDAQLAEEVIADARAAIERRVARRAVEESPEEVEVRRRRREAMVLHEGEGQIGREDIIQPRRGS